MSTFTKVIAENACQCALGTENGEYRVQISWPLSWGPDMLGAGESPVPILYLVDGNAFFFTATEVVRRLEHSTATGAVVVAIGYPLGHSVFSSRRNFDLTPPCTEYKPPIGRDGKPQNAPHGGADRLLDFIQHEVRPLLSETIFAGLNIGSEALFGHSYGGLFVLHALFTRPFLFDTFIAASPSIWWNERFILTEEAQFREEDGSPDQTRGQSSPLPILSLMFGEYEQFPVQRPGEAPDAFDQRRKHAAARRMEGNALEMRERLEDSKRLHHVRLEEFKGEDHGSAATVALNRGISWFLEDSKDRGKKE